MIWFELLRFVVMIRMIGVMRMSWGGEALDHACHVESQRTEGAGLTCS